MDIETCIANLVNGFTNFENGFWILVGVFAATAGNLIMDCIKRKKNKEILKIVLKADLESSRESIKGLEREIEIAIEKKQRFFYCATEEYVEIYSQSVNKLGLLGVNGAKKVVETYTAIKAFREMCRVANMCSEEAGRYEDKLILEQTEVEEIIPSKVRVLRHVFLKYMENHRKVLEKIKDEYIPDAYKKIDEAIETLN